MTAAGELLLEALVLSLECPRGRAVTSELVKTCQCDTTVAQVPRIVSEEVELTLYVRAFPTVSFTSDLYKTSE